MIKILKIDKNLEDQRLDKFLKRNFSSLSQSFIEKNLRKKNILVNNKTVKSKYLVKAEDIIKIFNFTNENYSNYEKKKNNNNNLSKSIKKIFEKSILYEDENFIVIDKWYGIATQGGSNISLSIDSIIKNISDNYNLVHRLDKETSGLMIIAKNLKYTKIFGKLFRLQKIKKTYLALCDGKPRLQESYVDLLLSSNDKNKSIESKTYYKILSHNQKTSLIQFEPKTGKKHQLRIVAKNLGCPIVGDKKYNLNNSNKFENLKLNASKIEFIIGEHKFDFNSNLPSDFNDFLKLKKIKIL